MSGVIVHRSGDGDEARRLVGAGDAFEVHEWTGGGPGWLHVHHEDDEAWHVVSGVLRFRFAEGRSLEAGPGTTVFVPAGVAHDYAELGGPSRYLLILTPRLRALIDALHAAPPERHAAIMRDHRSEILE
jgi:mannose-6-phosphate isomerase-like protein (cupin superfamily)